MEVKEYKTMYEVEDSHFWYKGMRKITKTLLEKYLSKKNGLKILDAGCGTGANIFFLKQYGQVSGFDISPYAINFCKKRGLKNIKKASIDKIPYKNNLFDLITCFDVLGHKEVRSPEQATKEFYRVLKPGGILLIRIAAYDWLKSHHDQAVHTKHRFEKKELIKILEINRLKLLKATYANTFLFPLALIKRLSVKNSKYNKEFTTSDVKPVNHFVNYLLELPFLLEAFLIKYFDLPFGLSVIVIGIKK